MNKSWSSGCRIRIFSGFVCLLWLVHPCHAQPDNWTVTNYTTADGLSSNDVICIQKDHQGFIWVGTTSGLNRFDGYTFTRLINPDGKPHILSSLKILDIIEDRDSILWIGTSMGLFRYDPELPASQIRHFSYLERKEEFTGYDSPVGFLCDDGTGRLWMSCFDVSLWVNYGVRTFDKATERFTYIRIDTAFSADSESQSRAYCTSTIMGPGGDLWMGTSEGLYRIDLKSGSTRLYREQAFPRHSLKWEITSLGLHGEDTLLIGTRWGHRIFRISAGTFGPVDKFSASYYGQTYQVERDASGANWIIENWILHRMIPGPDGAPFTGRHEYWEYPCLDNDFNVLNALLVEDPRSVWVGTSGHGLMSVHIRNKAFRTICPEGNDLPDNTGKAARHIQALLEDEQEQLWVLSRESGVNVYDRSRSVQKFIPVPHLFHHYNSLDVDAFGNWWLTSNQGYVTRVDREGAELDFRICRPDPADPASLTTWEGNKTLDVTYTGGNTRELVTFRDESGRLWFNTGTGIHERYDPVLDGFIHLDHRQADYINNDTCMEDSVPGEIWMPTVDGILRILPPFSEDPGHYLKSSCIISYRHDTLDPASLPAGTPFTLHWSRSGSGSELWVGMLGGGLCRMDQEETGEGNAVSVQFSQYSEKDGLCSNDVLGILEDEQGRLWLSTSNGLSRFDPRTEVFNNFFVEDGLPTNTFSHARPLKDKSGLMYFPTLEGVLWFHPDSIANNPDVPPVVITDIKLFNESLHPGGGILDVSASHAKALRLSYRQNFLALEYAALNYQQAGENQYRYRMDGLNEDWIFAGNRRYVEYADLDPGRYVFRVKGSNNDGIWNETGTSLAITILPPPWWRWYAFVLYGLLLTGMVLAIWRFVLNRVRMRQMVRLERMEKEKALELDRMKSGFFMNISHEFRTPLTLIQGILSKVDRQGREAVLSRESLGLLRRNADRLLQLINQLLDLSRMEHGQMKLRVAPGDLSTFLRVNLSSFTSMAERKEIKYEYQVPEMKEALYFDSDVLEKILVNLLSNAFKFTPDGGEVTVTCRWKEGSFGTPGWLEMEVGDTGIGIHRDQLEKVFDRFYQVDEAGGKDEPGSGIGLAHTKELVELCHGRIGVESEPGHGSRFSIHIPVAREMFLEHELGPGPEDILEGDANQEVAVDQSPGGEANNERPMVLVVEDNADLRNFISGILNKGFKVQEAENGQQGLEHALEIIPDLVISDLMMPVMNGMEMCRLLKENERTSHIPIIMLTARADRDSRLAGLGTGAESYLVKPFDREELLVRIQQLIAQREKLRQKYRTDFLREEVRHDSDDKADPFLQRFQVCLDQHHADYDFSVGDLAGIMYMSRAQLYRKIHALTGETPNELLRMYRIRKAAELIRAGEDNLTGIMYEVGFRSTSHFARSFRQYYGINPSDYRKLKQE